MAGPREGCRRPSTGVRPANLFFSAEVKHTMSAELRDGGAGVTSPAPARSASSQAAPTLQEVLGRVPALVAEIDSMSELSPGVPANAANLAAMHKAFLARRVLVLESEDAMVVLEVQGRKGRGISARLQGAPETWRCRHDGGVTRCSRASIASKEFPATEDGFFLALVYARESLRRLRSEGVCPHCCNAPGEFPYKELCLEGMPKCLRCMVRAAVKI